MALAPFRESESIVLDGNGDGTVTVGDVPTGERWSLARLTVQIDGGVTGNLGAECRVYVGSPLPANLIDGTNRAGLDISEITHPPLLQPSDVVTFVFEGGTPGATATASIQGTRQHVGGGG